MDDESQVGIIESMEEWRPDRQFKKADFPRKEKEGAKPGQPASDGSDSAGRAGRPARKTNANANNEAKSAENRSPAPSESTRLQSWSVPKLGGGRVLAGGSAKQSDNQGSSESQSGAQGAPFQRESAKQPLSKEKRSSQPSASVGADVTRQYLSQLVVLDPRAAGDLLRNWYWEKPGRSSPVQYVPPHNRIHLILRSLTKESLLALYEGMTPVERRQMEEIRKEPMHVNDREILKVRQYFMDRITGRV